MNLQAFKEEIYEILHNCYCEKDNSAGFRSRNVNEPSNVSNTVEGLLILEKLYPKFASEEKTNEDFDFVKIRKFLFYKMNETLKKQLTERSTISLAYCGLGLLLLGDNNSVGKITKQLVSSKIDHRNGWGQHLGSLNKNALATYHVFALLHRVKKKNKSLPTWIKNIKPNNQGCLFYSNPDDVPDAVQSVESLVLVEYIKKFFSSGNSINNNKKIINNYYIKNLKNYLKNPNNENIAVEALSGHTIFSFGLAAEILVDFRNPFFLDQNYLKLITNDFISKSEKPIPYVLELVRLVLAVKNSFDPFEILIAKKEIEDVSKFSALTAELVVLILVVTFLEGLLIYGVVLLSSKLIPNFEYDGLVKFAVTTTILIIGYVFGSVRFIVNKANIFKVWYLEKSTRRNGGET